MLGARVASLATIVIVVCSWAGSSPSAQTSSARPVPSATSLRAVLDRYCVTCHNEKRLTAGLALDRLDPDRLGDHAATWEKVVAKLRSGSMPPAGLPRPDTSTYDALATYLEAGLDRVAASNPNPGRSALHRLN